MFKLCLVLTFFLFLFNPAAAQKTDRETAGLLGVVKTLSSKQTNSFPGDAAKAAQTKQRDIITYDKNGNETERIIYDDYGLLIGTEIRTFTTGNNLIESVLTDPKKTLTGKRVYSFENNRLTQTVDLDGKGNTNLKQINSYDAKSRITEETYYIADKAFGKTTYKYDLKGNLAEASFFLADGTKAIAPIGPCLGTHRVTYLYNENGETTVVTAFEPDGKLKRTWKYAYNAKGNIVEDTRISPGYNKKFAYTYEYDLKGNWIKQTGIIRDMSKLSETDAYERKTIVTREITYY